MRSERGADGSTPAGRGRRSRTAAAVAFAACALALAAAMPGTASAAAPKATTGGTKDVTYATGTVTGTINPGGEATSYYFQFGPTHAYGGQTGIGSAGAGDKGVPVSVALAGLQPLTVYHYRLVAVNGAGTSLGKDRTFQTTKVPLSLSILSSPNPALYGGPIVVQGTLSGTGNAGRQVVLEGRPFPFTAPFAPVGTNTELTTATGSFSFTLLGNATSMQFQVVTTTKPVVVSQVATENVAVRVSSHLARTRRHGFARVYGTVTPAEDGAQVGILRITHGHGVLVGGTILRRHSTGSSSFSRIVRVHKGVYRVLVRVIGAAQVSNYGQPLLIR